MAAQSTTERTAKVRFDGDSAGMRRAAREAERELKRVQAAAAKANADFLRQTQNGADKMTAALVSLSSGVLKVGGAVGSAQGLAGAAAATAAMSGALLALPAVALGGAAALGTLKLATAGFADAVSAEDAAAWVAATKDMAPAAIATAQAVRDQNGRFLELRKTVQGRFFEGFDSDVRSLSEKYFPLMETGLGDIAGEMNSMGRASAKALMAPGAVDDVNSVLGGTRELLHELEPSIGNVLSGFLDLGGVGSTKLGSLGKAVNDVTQAFEDWVAAGVESGKINELIDGGIDAAKDFGRVLGNLGQIGGTLWSGLNAGEQDFLDGLVETTQAVEDFLNSVEGQDAIRTLGETLKVTADVARDVLSTALRELGPVVTALGPAFQEIVRVIGDSLVTGLEIVGPLLQGLAQFLSANKEVVGDLVPLVLGLAVAYKGLKVASSVSSWMGGIPALFGDIGRSADAASKKVGDSKRGTGLAGSLVGLGLAGTALAAGLGIAERVANDTINDKSEFGQLGKDLEKIRKELGRRIEISVGVNDLDARLELNKLLGAVNKSSGTVNINGNDVNAGFALRRILEEIGQGKETVTIDGKAVPAQEALAAVIGQINSGSGTVTVNGQTVPAGTALHDLLNRVSNSRADIGVGANTSGAQGVINGFIAMNNGRRIDIFVNAKGDMGGLASAGRLATGGRPFFSGRVYGPGTTTNDRAGLFALSRDEHVLTAAEVAAAGGHDAIFRLRRALMSGQIRGLATGGVPTTRSSIGRTAPRTAGAPRVSVAAPNVAVFVDGQELRAMVRTEIAQDKRRDKRRDAMGPGGAW